MQFEKIPTLEAWKAGTSVFGQTRSDDLQRVDRAIAQYNKVRNEMNFAQVGAALDYWIRVKQIAAGESPDARTGRAWRRSSRNRKMFVEDLYYFLNPRPETFLDDADRQARAAVNQAIKDAAKTIFSGTRVTFKAFGAKQKPRITVAEKLASATPPGAVERLMALKNQAGNAASAVGARAGNIASAKGVASTVGSAASAGKKLVSAAQTAASAGLSTPSFGEQTRKFITTITSAPHAVEEVMKVAGFHSLENFATNCAPLIGIISSGAKVTKKLYELVDAKLTKDDLLSRAHVVRPGDPKAALEALDRLMAKQIKERTQSFAIAGAALLAKTALTFADGGAISGPAVGAAQTLAELILMIGQIAQEYKEKEAANLVLAQITTSGEEFSVELFEKCPLVACYYLMIVDTSTILFVLTSEYGHPGWQLRVEEMKRCCDPILQKAAEFIDQSRLEVNQLSAHRIAFEKSLAKRMTESGESVWRRLSNLLKSGKTDPQTARSSVDAAIADPVPAAVVDVPAQVSVASA